jgi:hypothetical protein
MRCLSAVFALLLATLMWIPSAGLADEDLAIVHLPDWDQTLTVTPSEDGPLYTVTQKEGTVLDSGLGERELREKYPDLYARAQLNGVGAAPSPASAPPLAITTFSTSE